MTNQEAKFILQAYRHNGADATDPQFAAALEQARCDPELAQWLAEERQFDSAISAHLKAVPVPPDLKVNILAAQKVLERRSFWESRTWMAAAALFVLLLGISVILFRQSTTTGPQFADFRDEVADFLINRFDRLDTRSKNPEELKQWLAARNAPADFVIPAGLRDRPSIGCRVVEWSGKKISVMCFQLDGRDEVHLFVLDTDELRGVPRQPEFFEKGKWTLTSWSAGGKTYILSGDRGAEQLKKQL